MDAIGAEHEQQGDIQDLEQMWTTQSFQPLHPGEGPQSAPWTTGTSSAWTQPQRVEWLDHLELQDTSLF
jgi:hypothetical protein